jgi:hypothetical protein
MIAKASACHIDSNNKIVKRIDIDIQMPRIEITQEGHESLWTYVDST